MESAQALKPFADLDGKLALVTGAFSGLGRHFARTLAQAGCRVVLAGRRLSEGEPLLEELRSAGHSACMVPLDVRDGAIVAEAFVAAEKAMGKVNIVINSAGVAVTNAAMDVSEEQWQSVIDTNLNGAWRVAQCAARSMRDSGGGSIVNIASILGLRVAQQVPAYAAAKAGLIHLTRALALEWARYGIRVNALAPGYLATNINGEFFRTEAGQAMMAEMALVTAMSGVCSAGVTVQTTW
jgi:NAD(P)-dependent dehydrogenase (short-subunit alcohol dehydrogenase family)